MSPSTPRMDLITLPELCIHPSSSSSSASSSSSHTITNNMAHAAHTPSMPNMSCYTQVILKTATGTVTP
jgi:hypothetical protein